MGEVGEAVFENRPADTVEEDVDTVRREGAQAGVDIVAAMVDRGIETGLFQQPRAFAGPPAMPITVQPRVFAIWPATEPVAPAAAETSTV